MKNHTKEKHGKIREEYHAHFAKGLRSDVIYSMLAKKYYHSVSTIEQIVWQRGGYLAKKVKPVDPNQTNLF